MKIQLRHATLFADREEAKKLIDKSPPSSIVEIRLPKRSDEANRRFHASIRDISQQVQWFGEWISEEDWKRIFVASFYGQTVVRGVLGGFVVLNRKTSEMTSAEIGELQDFIYAFGSEHDVKWSNDDE